MGGTSKAMPIIEELFLKIQTSPFLIGNNQRGWRASFDWVFSNGKNWVKVLEGNYDDNSETRKVAPTQRELREYFHMKGASVSEADRFFSYHEARNWIIKGSRIVKWQYAADIWITNTQQHEQNANLSTGDTRDQSWVAAYESAYRKLLNGVG